MKRVVSFVLMVCLLLCGCGRNLPMKTENGEPWQESWLNIGEKVGVSELKNGFLNFEYNEVQAFDGIYYATFIKGEERVIKNAEGKDAKLYPAEIYLLVQDCDSPEDAAASVAQWLAVGEQSYEMEQEEDIREYACYRLSPKTDSPYKEGYLLLGIHNAVAVSVELMVTEDVFEKNRGAAADFLDSLQFRAQEG